MVSSTRRRPAFCTGLALLTIKCVNGNLAFLEMESESKLCMASPSRHTACVPPVLFPVLVLQWLLSFCCWIVQRERMDCGKAAIYSYNILI